MLSFFVMFAFSSCSESCFSLSIFTVHSHSVWIVWLAAQSCTAGKESGFIQTCGRENRAVGFAACRLSESGSFRRFSWWCSYSWCPVFAASHSSDVVQSTDGATLAFTHSWQLWQVLSLFLDRETGSQWPLTLFLFFFLGLLLSDLRSTKAFSFHNRSSSDFAYLVTIFSTIAPWRMFKLSPN